MVTIGKHTPKDKNNHQHKLDHILNQHLNKHLINNYYNHLHIQVK